MASTEKPPTLSVQRLSKVFVLHARGCRLAALDEISFDLASGRFLTLVGASGSGKSTVLKCIYRTYRPHAGRVLYRRADGQQRDLAVVDERELLALRRREIRFVSQFFQALPRQTAEQVVMRPLIELGAAPDQAQAAAREQLEKVGLPQQLRHIPPQTFSGGERQLVNLARALVVRPRLLLLDEPTSSLDPRSTEHVVRAIEQLKELDIAILAVLHDRTLTQRLSDATLEMRGGIDTGARTGGSAA